MKNVNKTNVSPKTTSMVWNGGPRKYHGISEAVGTTIAFHEIGLPIHDKTLAKPCFQTVHVSWNYEPEKNVGKPTVLLELSPSCVYFQKAQRWKTLREKKVGQWTGTISVHMHI